MHRVSSVSHPAAARGGQRIGALAALVVCALAAPPAGAQGRVDNPFVGATWYVNPDYARAVASSVARESDPALQAQMRKVATHSTAVWLDRIAAIQGTGSRMGLAQHLDAALAQQKGGLPVVMQLVIYNLPGRDCAALASNGELGPTEIGRYKAEYIDPIAAIEGDPKYAALRIVNIIEIDSLPNLVTNTNGKAGATSQCDTMKANGNYVAGIQYALSKLHGVENAYNYIDAAHHGWIGWDDNLGAAAQLFAETTRGAAGGFDTVQGFITNTANYSALVEPFIAVNDQTRPAKWIDWNRYVDEKSFAIAFRNKLVSLGFHSNIGMLIDTSRNGWGGSARPAQASTSGDLNTRIDESRVDRRLHAGNWCNQDGAGLGERPQVVGADGIHAYVWVKPPGESDGASSAVANDQGKGFDRMCDPTYTGNAHNGNSMTGALSGAPVSGEWFHAQFVQLVRNAYPPVSADADPGSSSGDATAAGSGAPAGAGTDTGTGTGSAAGTGAGDGTETGTNTDAAGGNAGTSGGAPGAGSSGSSTSSDGCGCSATGPADTAALSFSLLAAMAIGLRRRA